MIDPGTLDYEKIVEQIKETINNDNTINKDSLIIGLYDHILEDVTGINLEKYLNNIIEIWQPNKRIATAYFLANLMNINNLKDLEYFATRLGIMLYDAGTIKKFHQKIIDLTEIFLNNHDDFMVNDSGIPDLKKIICYIVLVQKNIYDLDYGKDEEIDLIKQNLQNYRDFVEIIITLIENK